MRPITVPSYVKLHYLIVPEHCTFVGEQPGGNHWRLDCCFSKSCIYGRLDRFNLRGPDTLAVKLLPDFDN